MKREESDGGKGERLRERREMEGEERTKKGRWQLINFPPRNTYTTFTQGMCASVNMCICDSVSV